jgi:hypothetical protein
MAGTREAALKNLAKSSRPGRAKGSTNKFTDLKTSFLNVYKRLGGDDAFLEWAQADPKNLAAFYIMLKSMLPKEVVADVRNDIQISWSAVPTLPEPDVIDVTPLDTPPPANPDKVSDNG